MNDHGIRIDGQRLLLRELRVRDMATMRRLLRDPAIDRFALLPTTGWPQAGLMRKLSRGGDRLRVFCRAMWRNICPEKQRTDYRLAIVDKATDRLIGVVSLYNVADDPSCKSFGVWIGVDYWGNRLMQETMALLFPWAFHTLGLERIVARAHCENMASIVSMKKIGFVEGQERGQARDLAGKTVEVVHFVLSRQRFKEFTH